MKSLAQKIQLIQIQLIRIFSKLSLNLMRVTIIFRSILSILSSDPSIFKLIPTSRKEGIIWFRLSHILFQYFQRALINKLNSQFSNAQFFSLNEPGNFKLLILFLHEYTHRFKKGYPYPFLSKTVQFEKKNISKKTLTSSDENSCTKNLAITDLANTDFETLTRSTKKKNSTTQLIGALIS